MGHQESNEQNPEEEQGQQSSIEDTLRDQTDVLGLLGLDIDEIKSELMEARREKDQFRALLQRVQADFSNYKKRSEEEWIQQQQRATQRLVVKLLPILDDLRLALDQDSSESANDIQWMEGIRLVQRKILGILESEGLSIIEAKGQGFDPNEHEAVMEEISGEFPEGQIISVFRDGFKLHGKVIRPVQVSVARAPSV